MPQGSVAHVGRDEAQRNWEAAYQAALVQDVLAVFTRRSPDLLAFDEVRKRLRLDQKNYTGLQEIEMNRIRGSVGRYQDFTSTFLPRRSELRERWLRLDGLAQTKGLPPIEVYQVGDAYFVLDGNHRVSIARRLGSRTIHAHVWEFPTPVGLSADADLEEVLIKSERIEFLERTRLDETRPDHAIVLTAPGYYPEMIYQIGLYQQALEYIDGEPFTYQQAAAAWYDMLYTPIVQIIQERCVLERFPGRTEADLFIWLWRYNQDLRAKDRGVHFAKAADDLARPGLLRPLARFWEHLMGLLKKKRG